MKLIQTVSLLLLLFCCNSKEHAIRKNGTIDTGDFEITVPDNWEYVEEEGIDSFVGKFVVHSNGGKFILSFDFSHKGHANDLIPSETEFVYENQWEWMPHHLFLEPGIIYTTGDIEATRKHEMQTRGITDSTQVRVEPSPKPEVKIKKEYIDSVSYNYVAYLTYKDIIRIHEIKLSEELLKHHVLIDSVGAFRRKLIYPKSGHSGMIGVYFKHLSSEMNFQINGSNLPVEVREQALNAFESIRIKQ